MVKTDNCFKVAMLQLLPGNSREENRKIGIEACKHAKRMGAQLAVFPEMWSTGYHIPQDLQQLREAAVSGQGEFVCSFGSLAKKLNMAIAITFLESFEPSPRNTVCVFDRFGNLCLSYSKVHTCDFGEERVLTRGERFPVAELPLESSSVKIGAMICYDREFPESARLLMLGGAEIAIVPNACPMEMNRISQLRARAYENMMGVVTVNYPKGQPDCNGHSTAFDGIAYRPGDTVSRDTLVLEAGEREGIYMADLPLRELRAYRKSEVHGNAYRRPECYHALLSQEVQEPFIRSDRR